MFRSRLSLRLCVLPIAFGIFALNGLLAPPRAAIADSRPITMNGKPFFLIGLYEYPTVSATSGGWPPADNMQHLPELSQAGFNSILLNLRYVDPTHMDNAWKKYGISTMADIGRPDPPAELPYNISSPGVQQDGSVLDLKIKSLAKHPGLLGYYTLDEVYWGHKGDDPQTSPTRLDLTKGRAWLHEAGRDPSHPIFDCEAAFDGPNFKDWSSIADVFGEDVYPIFYGANPPAYPAVDLSVMGAATKHRLQTLSAPSAPVFMVLEGCSGGEFNHTSARRPNFIENRFMAYDCIINGAKGIMWWGSCFLDLSKPDDASFWDEIKKIAGELHQMPYLADAGPEQNFTLGNGTLEGLLKTSGRAHILIVANKSSASLANATISVPGWQTSRVLFEGRSLSCREGSFTDSFQPWEVHVYTDQRP